MPFILVREQLHYLREKGDQSTEGYYTLTDPLSEKFLTASCTDQLTIEGNYKTL